MVGDRKLRAIRAAFLIAAVAAVGATSVLVFQYFSFQREEETTTLASARAKVAKAAHELDGRFSALVPVAEALSRELSGKPLEETEIRHRLRGEISAHPQVFGVGIAYKPYAYSAGRRLFAPYYMKRGEGGAKEVDVGDIYDYTGFEHRWYHDPMLLGSMWNEPYFGTASQAYLAEYAVPLYESAAAGQRKRPTGVVYVNYSLDEVQRFVDTLGLSATGYSYIITAKGRYVVAPSEEDLRDGKTIFERAWSRGDAALNSMAIRAIKGGRGHIDHLDPVTGQSSWVIYEPIPSTGWSLVSVILKDEFKASNDAHRRKLFLIIATSLAAMIFVGGFLVSLFLSGETAAWAGSIIVVAGSVAAIGGTWMVERAFFTPAVPTAVKIVDPSTLERFLDRFGEGLRSADMPKLVPAGATVPARRLTHVPTGVFIQSVAFTSSSHVAITGYIWQRYRAGIHDGLSRGFVLPDAESPVIEEAYRRDVDCPEGETSPRRGCTTLVGWYFAAKLRQSFDYRNYPLDRQDVWLRVWHKDFNRHVVLSPDLAAYNILNPRGRPGLDEELTLPGWTIVKSGFNYRFHEYNTDFGIPTQRADRNKFPELYFNVHLKRDLYNVFVPRFTPIIVVISMLFGWLLIGSKHSERASWFGSSSQGFLIGCAGLFFVIIFSHTAVREQLAVSYPVYLEYFYFGLYLAIFFVSMNSILFAWPNLRLVSYRDNLVPKTVMLPLYCVSMLAITFAFFY